MLWDGKWAWEGRGGEERVISPWPFALPKLQEEYCERTLTNLNGGGTNLDCQILES